MTGKVIIDITIENVRQFCKEHPTVEKDFIDAKNVDDARKLLIKELGKDVKIEVIRKYRQELKKIVSMEEIKYIEEFQLFCDAKEINDKIKEFNDFKATIQFVKETYPGEKEFSLETVTAYKLMLENSSIDLKTQIKNLKIDAFQYFCKKNKLSEKIKATNDDNEAWELVKKQTKGEDFSLEIVTAYREILQESHKGETVAVKDINVITSEESKEMDDLKKLNEKLNDENCLLKSENEMLKQEAKVLKDQKEIKEVFTSKIPSLNDIASSEDKTSVCINKEILVKVTKYVDDHNLVKLERIILNGYDLNSAIVQSVLIKFILQNSLL